MPSPIKAPKAPSYCLPLLVMTGLAFWIMCLVGQNRLVLLPTGYVTATIFVYPFVCTILDIITEIYGYRIARKTIWASLSFLYLFAFVMFIFARLPIPPFFTDYNIHFNAAMYPLLRNISIASVAILFGQYINISVLSRLYLLTHGKRFALRSITSSIIGETVTLVLAIWGFFHVNLTNHQIISIIVNELVILYAMTIILSFPAVIIVGLLKTIEPAYNKVDFNPFESTSASEERQ